jgi:hypothetical protein
LRRFGITRRLASAPSGISRRSAFRAVRHLARFQRAPFVVVRGHFISIQTLRRSTGIV